MSETEIEIELLWLGEQYHIAGPEMLEKQERKLPSHVAKCPVVNEHEHWRLGPITIQFCSGDILCEEATGKTTFQDPSSTLE